MFIQKLQEEIDKKGITMNKLAAKAGFSQSNTDRWKKGSMPNTEILIKICQYLNVSADYLLDLDENQKPETTKDEECLLKNFRQCSAETQRSIMLLAKAGAEEEQKREKSLISEEIG